MSSFKLDALSSKELFEDVLVRLVSGGELTLNYFELKSTNVVIPFHEHPVEHFVFVLEGEIEFIIEADKIMLKERDFLFLPAEINHSARVIRSPVHALELFTNTHDEYYTT
jgi:quercetin dioxygenase-like cupin family protein